MGLRGIIIFDCDRCKERTTVDKPEGGNNYFDNIAESAGFRKIRGQKYIDHWLCPKCAAGYVELCGKQADEKENYLKGVK